MSRITRFSWFENELTTKKILSGDAMKTFLIVKLGTTYPLIAERYGDFEDWIISNLELQPDRIGIRRPFAGEDLPAPRDISGVIVTGSHAMVSDQQSWSEYTGEWLTNIVAAEIPVLGICYGHQLLAHALGGKVGPSPRGSEFGTVEMRLADGARDDGLMASLPDMVEVQVCHSEFVLDPPPGATRLASSARDPHLALAYGPAAWGVQFHPEFEKNILVAYIRECSDLLRSQGQDPEALIRSSRAAPRTKALLRRFGQIVINH